MTESITKELRDYLASVVVEPVSRVKLARITDRIDEAHMGGMRRAYDVGFASADDWYTDKTDEELAKHGLVRLDFRGGTKMEVVRGSTTSRHSNPTPAERIRAAVQELTNEDGSDGTALGDLLKVADELEGEGA